MSEAPAPEADDKVVAKTLRDAKVGELVLYRYSRGGEWIELEVVGITPASVLCSRESAWRRDPVKFSRILDKPGARIFDLQYGAARGKDWGLARGSDEVEKLEREELDRDWLSEHRHKIASQVHTIESVPTMRQVAALIGYHDTAAKDCKQ